MTWQFGAAVDKKKLVTTKLNIKSLELFVHIFQFVLASPRSNTTICFWLVNTSRPPLKNSTSPLKLAAWASLLNRYPGRLNIHSSLIFPIDAELEYIRSQDIFILSKNLVSVLDYPIIIDKKLSDHLILKWAIKVPDT